MLLGVVHLHLGDQVIAVLDDASPPYEQSVLRRNLTILDRKGNQAHLPGRTRHPRDGDTAGQTAPDVRTTAGSSSLPWRCGSPQGEGESG